MTAQDIIETMRAENPQQSLQGLIYALEDGEYLASIGLGDDDQTAVEDAHSELTAELKRYNQFSAQNGEAEFEGKIYALTSKPELSNRIFSGWWGDVSEGEEYTAEWSAPAMGEDGNEYVVRWQFSEMKGAEREADSLDWDDVNEVVAA
ncbi:hypothetical protein LA374_00440 [Aeromonas schubertii]|uniref:Phage protein n=1 Tax=Aeromonas schubertii TaxID=652 RepID=A0ABS7V6V2_9GAMM|nr:hypothetical protein [Aeromonas schubertii]MBZ6064686.1 hypothetical protein [Aeromonas schubertii]